MEFLKEEVGIIVDLPIRLCDACGEHYKRWGIIPGPLTLREINLGGEIGWALLCLHEWHKIQRMFSVDSGNPKLPR